MIKNKIGYLKSKIQRQVSRLYFLIREKVLKLSKQPDKLNNMVANFQSLRKFLVEVGIIVLIGYFSILLYYRIVEKNYIVEPLDVPQPLSDLGYTDEVLASMLRDEINLIFTHADIHSGQFKMETVGVIGSWEDKLSDIKITPINFSLDRFIQEIKSLVGNQDVIIGGEVIHDHGKTTLIARKNGQEISHVYIKNGDMDQLLRDAAEGIVKKSDPHVLAIYYHNIYGMDEDPNQKVDNMINYTLREGNLNQKSYAHILQAWRFRMNGNYNAAIDACRQAIAENQDSFYAHYLYGYVLDDKQEYDKAIEQYEIARSMNPRNPYIYSLRGIAHRNLQEYDKAITKYKKAIELDPEFPYPYNNWANVLEDQEDHKVRAKRNYTNAIRKFEEAIAKFRASKNPESVLGIAHDNLGMVQVKQGDIVADYNKPKSLEYFRKALENYDKSIYIKPEYPGPYYNRGVVLEKLGRYQEAIISYEKFLGFETDKEKIKSLKLKIRDLEEKINQTNLETYENSIPETGDRTALKPCSTLYLRAAGSRRFRDTPPDELV